MQAEMDAAASLPCHPLLATLQAACFDDVGNWCCVMPYAGCSLQHITESPYTQSSTTAEEKLAMARTVIAHSLVVYSMMQEAVSVSARLDYQEPEVTYCLNCRKRLGDMHAIAFMNLDTKHQVQLEAHCCASSRSAPTCHGVCCSSVEPQVKPVTLFFACRAVATGMSSL